MFSKTQYVDSIDIISKQTMEEVTILNYTTVTDGDNFSFRRRTTTTTETVDSFRNYDNDYEEKNYIYIYKK